jgi:hypothetical protein
MRWLKIFGVFAVLYIGYKAVYPDYNYRYRLEVTALVEHEAYVGSSVIEVTWQGGPRIFEGGRYGARGLMNGRAPVVNLGDRGVIIASLSDSRDYSRSALFICAKAFGNTSSDGELSKLRLLKGRRELTPDNWPQLLWFPTSASPSGVSELDRKNFPDLPSSIGGQLSLYCEPTDEPISHDIQKLLPWFQAWQETFRRQLIITAKPNELTLAPYMLIGDSK